MAPGAEQERLPAGEGAESCREPGGAAGGREQHPATAGSAQGAGLEETADAGITQTDVGGIPGRRGNLAMFDCV